MGKDAGLTFLKRSNLSTKCNKKRGIIEWKGNRKDIIKNLVMNTITFEIYVVFL